MSCSHFRMAVDDQVDALSQLLGWFRTTLFVEDPGGPPEAGDPLFRLDPDDEDYNLYGGDDYPDQF